MASATTEENAALNSAIDTWTANPSNPSAISTFVAACVARGDAVDTFARDLATGKWPGQVKRPVNGLIEALGADIIHHRNCEELTSAAAVSNWLKQGNIKFEKSGAKAQVVAHRSAWRLPSRRSSGSRHLGVALHGVVDIANDRICRVEGAPYGG